MPEPRADPNLPNVSRVAVHALVAGITITLLKAWVFWLTGSVAVLSDALESIINVVAAGVMLYSIWYTSQPPDRNHAYGHGKIEFFAVGFEGAMIVLAAVVIVREAVGRLMSGGPELHLDVGLWLLMGVGLLMAALASYVWWAGRRYGSAVLIADGKHLMTDVASTGGVLAGLLLVQWTGWTWLDAVVAILAAAIILTTGGRLLWSAFQGLMDHADPEDERRIVEILDDEVTRGTIHGYHKVRHRHTGAFHWIDMHIGVDADLTVEEGHEIASKIEHRIEQKLGNANATAHLEPYGRHENE